MATLKLKEFAWSRNLRSGCSVGKQISGDFVLGVWADDFDVEYVRMYGLIKPDG